MASIAAQDVPARQVDFSLFRGDTRLVEGTFTLMISRGISCFGTNREVAIKGIKEKAVFFEGVVLEHRLNPDRSASIGLKCYSTEPDPDSPIWYRQIVEVEATLSMGSESGLHKLESVILDKSHEFVFRSHTLV